MYVTFNKKFQKRFDKVQEEIKLSFKKRLELFIKNPEHPSLENHKLHGKWKDYSSINITGNWRAIYQYVDNKIEWVEFVEIGTHSELYK